MSLDDLDITDETIKEWKRKISVGKCNVITMADHEENIRVTVCRPRAEEMNIRMVEYEEDGRTIYNERKITLMDGIPIDEVE